MREGRTSYLWINDGFGNFPLIDRKTLFDSIGSYTLLDFNQDGYLDFVQSKSLFLNDGNLNFTRTSIPAESLVIPGDFNGDGGVDLFAFGNPGLIFLNKNGSFNKEPDYTFPYDPLAINDPVAAVADFDGDSDLDVVFGNTAQVFLNADIKTIFEGSLCSMSDATVDFQSTIKYNPDNIFSVELSDDKGNFTEPVSIGVLKSTESSGKVLVTIPASIKPGAQYRLRVNSSSPAITGSDNKVNISINTIPLPLLGNDISTCSRDTVISSNYCDADSYEWTTPGKLLSVEKNILATEGGNYSLSVSKFGCLFKDEITVTINYIPQIDILINKQELNNFPDTLYAKFPLSIPVSTLPLNGVEYKWDFGNESIAQGTNAAASYYEPGSITILLQGSNHYGCSSTTSTELQLRELYIPNVITPNGDNKNDRFIIKGAEEHPTNLTVFNRWGEKLYENTQYSNDWSAEKLASGVYYFQLNMKIFSQSVFAKGWLNVIK